MDEKNGDSVVEKIITLSDVAALCVMSERSVQRLTKAGVIEQAKDSNGHFIRGRYILGDCIPRLFEYTRDLATVNDPAQTAYVEARAQRMRCAAESAQLDLRLKKGALIETTHVTLVVATILRSLRDNLRGLPSRLMHPLRAETDLVKIRQTLADGIDGVLRKTASGDLSAKLRRELKAHYKTAVKTESQETADND
jgi:phage terminase Nu1 subunit (DNA packaging protein)